MLIGNTESQNLLRSYLEKAVEGSLNVPAFYILSGPAHIGKSTFVQELIGSLLGNYAASDFLMIRDFSQQLGKKHSLKIEYDKSSETSKTLMSEYNYQDIGVREINAWLQQSFIGKMKIVFIENIERIVPAAANAFLKSCEEPLPHRIIIASTSHTAQLLDTILSRALLLHFNELSPQQLEKFADEHQIFPQNLPLKQLVCTMSMGKPGQLLTTYALLKEREDLQTQFSSLIPLLTEKKEINKAFMILKWFKNEGILESFLDGWIAYCEMHNLSKQWARWLKVKKMMKSTVNGENLLLYGLLD